MLKNHLRNFDKKRKEKMQGLESILFKLIRNNNYAQKDTVPAEEVKSILIIRNNKRIGNMYFLLPFVKQVRKNYPNAHITLMLNQAWQGDVFKYVGIDEICFSNFSFKQCIDWAKLMFAMRKKVFDMIFVPNSSAGDTIISALIPARNKISTHDTHRQHALTHSLMKSDDEEHMALSSLYLLTDLGFDKAEYPDHLLAFSAEEIEEGKKAFDDTCEKKAFTLAYFRGARGDKVLSEQQWRHILSRIEQAYDAEIQWIEILSPDITSPLESNRKTFSSGNMRYLASYLRHVNGFICCDTGPLHLADAADVSCVGIFNKTDPKIYGLLGKNCAYILDIEDFDAKALVEQLNK